MEYWTIIDNSHAGPFTAGQLADMKITPDTLIWHEGLTDWTPARDIASLAPLFAAPAPSDASESPMAQEATEVEVPAATEIEIEVSATPQEPQPQEQAPGPQPYEPYQPYQPYGQQNPGQPYGQPGPQPYGQPMMQTPAEECPPTYLAWSIAVTILCCLIFGVAGIICSTQVKSAWQRGDMRKARRMSEWAQWCIILSIVGGLLWIPLQMAFSSFSIGDFNF